MNCAASAWKETQATGADSLAKRRSRQIRFRGPCVERSVGPTSNGRHIGRKEIRHAGRIRPAKLFVQRVLKHTCGLIMERKASLVRTSAEVGPGGFEVKRGGERAG